MASIALENITKQYAKGQNAVDGISLDIPDKEFAVLVGPSGCGKTTTLRLIAGLEELTGGKISIGGRDVSKTPPKDRDIAMVFQNYALYPHMSVYKNMSFGLELRKTPKEEIKRRVEEAAGILGLKDLLARKPGALSGGQAQRVALGRAIVRQPAAFLLDEPLSNLDAKLRAQMRSELIRLHRRLGATFVYVTHDQVEAMAMATRIIIMKDGRVQQAASPLECYDEPQNTFVASFIGTPEMNIIEMKALYTSSGAKLSLGPWSQTIEGAPGLREFSGKTVYIGIRPEELKAKPLTGPGVSFSATAEVVEKLGNECYVHWSAEIGPLESRCLPKEAPEAGASLEVSCPLMSLHMFGPDGNRISMAESPL